MSQDGVVPGGGRSSFSKGKGRRKPEEEFVRVGQGGEGEAVMEM